MRKSIIFLIGFILGVLATWLFFTVIMLTYRVGVNLDEDQTTNVEVTGKHGVVLLHTGMSKDSVKILVGKPDEVELREIGNTIFESWGYKINKDYLSDLDIEFRDGQLEGLSQY